MDHGRDAPDQRCHRNGSASCDLSHQIGRKGTVGLFLLVNDPVALHLLRRLPHGDRRVPAIARGGRPDDPHAAARRSTALSARRRRPATDRASGCPSPRRMPRCANASSPMPRPGEAVGLRAHNRGDRRRLRAVAARGHGAPPVPSCGRAASVSRRSGGRPGAGASGRSGPGRSLCRTVRATRACAGGRRRRAQRVDARRTPPRRHPLQRHRSRERDVRGRTSQHPPAVAGRAGARAGWGSGGTGKPALSDAALSPRGSGRRHLGNGSCAERARPALSETRSPAASVAAAPNLAVPADTGARGAGRRWRTGGGCSSVDGAAIQ